MADSANFNDLNFFHKNIDWEQINDKINSIEWDDLLQNKTVDEQFNNIITECLAVSRLHVPCRRKPKHINKIPIDRKTLMRQRTKLNTKLKLTHSVHDKQLIKEKLEKTEAKLIISVKNELQLDETKAISCIKENPKYFYKYASNKSKVKTPIGPLMIDGILTDDNLKICDELRLQYEKVFSQPLLTNIISDSSTFFETNNDDDSVLSNIEIKIADILKQIKTISNNAAAGPDQLPAIFLKNCASPLAKPLLILYNNSLNTGIIPSKLKSAKITPIFKGGSKGEAKNYRPIALTSHIIKVLEKIITSKLTIYLETNNKMNEGQHGFRSGRSCLSQLLAHHEMIVSALEGKSENLDVIYLDFAKAFDKVDHGILLHKARQLGVSGRIGVWLHNFLSNRTQFVAVNGVTSSVSHVLSGVPQGSVLGPLLFLIHIHDINKNVKHSHVASFADDTRMLKETPNINETQVLQMELNQIYQWAEKNNMTFNDTKFEHLSYYTKPPLRHNAKYSAPDGSIIANPNNVKDLGVSLSNDCMFNLHINTIAKRARGQSGWILRTFKTRDKLPMLTLFKALVIPILDYCCQLWNPWKTGEKQILEAVQRSFTRKICVVGSSNYNYWDRLENLKLYSLERRRERYIIMYVWKVMMGRVANSTNLEFKEHICLGRQCVVKKINTRAMARIKTIKDNTFSNRGAKLFNALPSALRNLNEVSLENFKARLDKFLATIPDQPVLPGYPIRTASNSIIDQLAAQRVDRVAH